jgi:Spy/CpxP family protein refolding chaperone
MKRSLRTITLAALVALMAAGAWAVAQDGDAPTGEKPRLGPGPHPGHGGGPGFMLGRLGDELGLTEEQRAEIDAIFQSYREAGLDDRRREAQQARRDLRNVIRHAAHLGEALALEEHRMVVEIAQVLTEEQLQRAAELREQHSDRFGGPRTRRGGHPHGG